MTIQIDYPLGITGLTITAQAYGVDSGDVAGQLLTFNENVHRLGYYSTVTAALSMGSYWLQISHAGTNLDAQWVTIPTAGAVVLGGIGPGAIGLLQLSNSLKAASVQGYLVSTGTTTPDTADLWCVAGLYQNLPAYQAFSAGLFAWYNGSGWTISAAIGVNGPGYWTTGAGAHVDGPYVAQGTAAGVPMVVARGTAVLAEFQPEQSFLSPAQLATIPTSGTLARTTDVVVNNYITVPASVAVASQVPTVVPCVRGDTLRAELPAMGNLAPRLGLIMTAKARLDETDEQAIFQIVEGVGLTRLNATAVTDATLGVLTVTDANTGLVTVELAATVTAMLAVADLFWDVQVSFSTGITTPISGTINVIPDVTRVVL